MKRLLTILLFLYTTQPFFAQEIPINFINRINEVNFIFEGVVIHSKPYYAHNGKYIYTSNTVEITKILKGDIKCGTIEIITKGGEIDKEKLEVSHSLELLKGSSGIFLCSETDRPLSIIDFYPASNPQKLEPTFETQSFIRYWWDGHKINAADIWQNYDSLVQVYNVSEFISGLHFIDCERKISDFLIDTTTYNEHYDEPDEDFPIYSKEIFDELISYADFKRDNYSRNFFEKSNSKIFYNLDNVIITGTTQKYLEFDVTVRDNLGNKFLDQSAIRLKYDTLVFGNNIVSNNNIMVTRGVLNNDSNCYSQPTPSDVNNNTILIPALESTFSQCKAPILQTPQSIMHIKMKIQACDISNGLALVDTATFFSPSLILDYSAYAEYPADTFQTNYDELEHNQILDIPACKATITDFYPKEVAGGIKDTLTIKGFQFGNNRGAGNLYFKNANDGGTTEVFLDSLDYLLWSDTLIKIHVPSFDSSYVAGTAYINQPAGTGYFRLVNNLGEEDTSATELKIKFSVQNNSSKKTYIISPREEFNQKITFHCSHEVANYADGKMKEVIKKALNDWTCLTGIDWELGADTLYTDSIAKNDSLCVITFANLNTNVIASSLSWRGTCPISGDPAVYYETDIEIDTTNLFFIDTISTSIPPDYMDFYSIILHELGHSHNLKHIIGSNSIMHYSISPGQIKRDLENDYSCDEGGNWVINFSTDLTNNLIDNCGLKNINANPSPPCSHLVVKEIDENVEDIFIYPNPFSNRINIEMNTLNASSTMINIYDIQGKLILKQKHQINSGLNIIPIETIEFQNGTYLITILKDNKLSSYKIIKYEN